MGLLSKAISIQVVTERRGGLLSRSLLFMNPERGEIPAGGTLVIVDSEENIERLLERIGSLAADFSYFPRLFSLLADELRLSQTALFLYNGYRGRFTPWLARGLDPALAAVLEFTEDQWRAVLSPDFLLPGGRSLFPALRRELPRPLWLVPFVHRGSLEGSLLVCNGAALTDRPRVISLFKTLSRQAGAAVAGILKPLRGLEAPATMYRSPEEALPAILESGSGRPESFVVMDIPLASLFDTLARFRCGFDRSRFREILLFVINAAFSHLGAATPRGEGNIVLVARAARHYSVALLTATLSRLVADFFPGLFAEPPVLRPSRVYEYPACGLKPLEILGAF